MLVIRRGTYPLLLADLDVLTFAAPRPVAPALSTLRRDNAPMAVPEDALAEVERFCEERTPPDLRDQLRLAERRAPWDPELGSEWTTTHIAQLRYDIAKATWSLHWRGSDDRWHPDDRVEPSRDYQRLLAEIATDPTGIFWG